MQELDDIALLREYDERDSEEAFTTLAARHVNKVYSVALRHTGNPHQAEEITQAVFVILARKSRRLGKRVILSGWLYQTARLTAKTFLRSEIRRTRREREAHMQSVLNQSESETWLQIAPLLDDAMAGLNETDRHAVVLRFFDAKSMREVGAALGANEDAAKKRVNRALEKLQRFFLKRGITSTTAIIAGAISANSVQAAPVALAEYVAAVAMAKGAAVSGSTLTLIKGALKIMAWTKAKTAIVGSVVVLLAVGTTTVTVKQIQEHKTYPWQVEGFNSSVLDQQQPQVRILSSKARHGAWGTSDKMGHVKLMGTGVSAKSVVQAAYNFQSPTRTVVSADLPQRKYDYIASLSDGNEEALQQEVKRNFNVLARREMREADGLFLKVQTPNAPNLKPSRGWRPHEGSSSNSGAGQWSCQNSPLSRLADYLENYLGIPIIDQTGLTNDFDIDLKWKQSNWTEPNPDGLKQAVLDQLGLELVPSHEPIEMLVVEKVK
jgi:uncharacterized protein (TIGR03435 family)